MMSLAVTPGWSAPSTRTSNVFGRRWSSDWVARTCSTSVVPMPKASAPNAPWVAVCESPHTIVMPGCVSPSSGPMTCTMPWCGESRPWSGMPNRATVRLQAGHLPRGDLVDDRQRAIGGRDRVIDRCHRLARAPHAEAALAKAIEGLRARHLVDEVEIDADHVGRAARAGDDDVVVPDLLDDRARAR